MGMTTTILMGMIMTTITTTATDTIIVTGMGIIITSTRGMGPNIRGSGI